MPITLCVALATAGFLALLATNRRPPSNEAIHKMAALSQTYIAVNAGAPLHLPFLIDANGRAFVPEQMQGHWSIIFFGFTACPAVCPATLTVLSAVARNPESGIAAGSTQVLFVSVDPEHDTRERMSVYLSHFDRHVVGLTGTPDAIASFGREVGAGYQPVGSLMDHSTSLFVVDPKGRLAAILLRPNEPARIVADLTELRHSYAESPTEVGR
jgi:protein SCO1/2